jgi:hypothetical protein
MNIVMFILFLVPIMAPWPDVLEMTLFIVVIMNLLDFTVTKQDYYNYIHHIYLESGGGNVFAVTKDYGKSFHEDKEEQQSVKEEQQSVKEEKNTKV